jgi:two-component system chemotaxis sensor kinase CheA
MDELLREFLLETGEHVDAAGEQLVRLERDPSDRAMVAAIFRLLHTIKGTCGFLGLARLGRLAHATEALLGQLREGSPPTVDTITLILAAMDRIRYILSETEARGEEPEGQDDDLIGVLAALGQAKGPTTATPSAATVSPAAPYAEPADINVDSEPPGGRAGDTPSRKGAPATIRVSVDSLENIMLLVSELVLTRNQLAEVTRATNDDAINAALQHLSAVTTDLQDSVMRARMQPLERIFATLPRLVRELAQDLGKRIDLIVEGAATELDRQLIELVRDPLTHMIRNCADHGLESPQERLAGGKPEAGMIRVTALQEAGQITIEVADDGRGLDLERIAVRAVSQGLVDRNELAGMSADEIVRFVFMPGFSTATTVTNISGRGVGLDVVRANIESIGGTVSIASQRGRGTRLTMRIPLTLAIAPALIVKAGGQRFALPQLGVIEIVSVGADSPHRIERVQGSEVLRLRDDVLPVTHLASMLGLPVADRDPSDQLIVVLRVSGIAFGVIADAVDDVQEIVVKPVGSLLSHLRVYSGQTILGDGSVVLILDSMGIAGLLGLQRSPAHRTAPQPDTPTATPKTRIVIFRAGAGACKALPLSLITRIENIRAADIERTGSAWVVRHRDRLMPLLPLAPGMVPRDIDQPVLVIGIGSDTIGLLIDEIVDIVEEPIDIQMAGTGPGRIGSADIGGRIAEFIDVTHFIREANPGALARVINRRFKVLLVDDRQFFRDMLTPVLSAAGYHVLALASAAEALKALARGITVDAVVTDTDMPDMDGYEFARRLREDPVLRTIPVIALAAQIGEKAQLAAQASGISGVCGKFDRVGLVECLARLLDPSTLANHAIEDRVLIGSDAA